MLLNNEIISFCFTKPEIRSFCGEFNEMGNVFEHLQEIASKITYKTFYVIRWCLQNCHFAISFKHYIFSLLLSATANWAHLDVVLGLSRYAFNIKRYCVCLNSIESLLSQNVCSFVLQCTFRTWKIQLDI